MTSLLPGSGEQKLTPQAILDMNYAFARTAILVASVHLLLFTHLANQVLTFVELAACADTVPEPTERLLQGPDLLGLVEREGFTFSPLVYDFIICSHFCRFISSEVVRWLTESGLRDVQPFHVTGPFPTVIARKAEEA